MAAKNVGHRSDNRRSAVIEYAYKNDVTPLFSSKQFADPWINHDTVR